MPKHQFRFLLDHVFQNLVVPPHGHSLNQVLWRVGSFGQKHPIENLEVIMIAQNSLIWPITEP